MATDVGTITIRVECDEATTRALAQQMLSIVGHQAVVVSAEFDQVHHEALPIPA